jgi:hypothetical protein
MAATAETINYDAVFTSTLMNYNETLVDNISKTNVLLYRLMKEGEDGYVPAGGGGLGARKQVNLMYGLGSAEPYADYDTIDTAPTDGITAGFWDWRQLATTIQISRIEERKNAGKFAIFKLLKAKTKQATITIQEKFARAMMQGNGVNSAVAGQIETNYTNPSTGRKFIDPLPLLVKKDPTTSTTIGDINQSTETWWRNIAITDGSSNFAGFLFNLDDLYTQLTEGPGGPPTLVITDRRTYLYYMAACRSQFRQLDYKKANFPFDAAAFHGHPLTWDVFMPNVSTGLVAQVTTQGTLYMLSPQFIEIEYDPETNFMNTDFVTPPDQDAKSSKLLWYGAWGVSQRRKQGVLFDIDTTPTS